MCFRATVVEPSKGIFTDLQIFFTTKKFHCFAIFKNIRFSIPELSQCKNFLHKTLQIGKNTLKLLVPSQPPSQQITLLNVFLRAFLFWMFMLQFIWLNKTDTDTLMVESCNIDFVINGLFSGFMFWCQCKTLFFILLHSFFSLSSHLSP